MIYHLSSAGSSLLDDDSEGGGVTDCGGVRDLAFSFLLNSFRTLNWKLEFRKDFFENKPFGGLSHTITLPYNRFFPNTNYFLNKKKKLAICY